MGRNYDDIPEAFRKAMEGEGGLGGRRGGPRGQPPGRPWWWSRWLWLVGLIVLIFASFNWIITTYTDWLWFSSLTYQNVWLKQLGYQLASFLLLFLVGAAVLLGNWHYARRRASGARSAAAGFFELPGLTWIVTVAALFLAFVFASAGSTYWEEFLRYFYRVPFNLADPIFNRDVGFYIFELPIYRFLQGWLIPLLFFTLVGVTVFYFAAVSPALQQGTFSLGQLPAYVRRHVALLGALIFLLWSAGYWLDTFRLLYSASGVVFGAGYTDLNANLLALQIGMVLTVLIALALVYGALRQDFRPVALFGVLWLANVALIGAVYPAILQRYLVQPNELARERPFIENNIEFTRRAYGLDQVDLRSFDNIRELERADLEDNEAVLKNIRIWDYRPLHNTYTQLQVLRRYYQFSDIDIDRYDIDGEVRQVMLAGRELDKSRLSSQTWVNQRLIFTHGYGIVMSPVDQVRSNGQPEFWIRDLPPVSTVPIEVNQPEIYYGERMLDQVYVGSVQEEFNYPQDQGNVSTSYEGTGGVAISNFFRRLALAIRFNDLNLILSNYITPETRAIFDRQIVDRARKITPFLEFDHDPYIVATDEGLVWILDAYTTTDTFPYATPMALGEMGQINYIRNSVKVTIDAYNGDVNYYVTDQDDPIIQTYMAAFPTLFQPIEEMPEDLYRHIRYPEGLFLAQTRQYLSYHMTEPQVFYNQEDLWQVPMEITDAEEQPIEPYYVMFNLPGEEETEYLLIQPYTPSTRENMVAWLAARNDPPNYGELVAYELPRRELVFGPLQVEARIDQDPQISQQLSLWSQRGSRVIRGNMIVIPLGNSFLYVEPIYLVAETSSLPELQRVIVASGERVVMRETLPEALTALVENEPTVDQIVEEPAAEDTGAPDEAAPDEEETQPEPAPEAPEDATVEELIQSANGHFSAAEQAQREGDWATYGREIEALQRDLQRLLELSGGTLPSGALEEEASP